MSIIISSPVAGSLKINNTSASPMNQYLCNLKTVTVNGDYGSNTARIINENGQPIIQIPYMQITSIGASGFGGNWSLVNAVDAIASLIIT